MSALHESAFVALGSNLGDRARTLRRACEALARLPGTRVEQVSSMYETVPWGLEQQPNFYNQVAQLSTTLPPLDLLRAALAIEEGLGRVRAVRWGPRTIDLDLLLYGEVTVSTPELTLPHPRMLARAFVLVPLAELAPDVVVSGRSVREHLAALGDVSRAIWRVQGETPWDPAGSSGAKSVG